MLVFISPFIATACIFPYRFIRCLVGFTLNYRDTHLFSLIQLDRFYFHLQCTHKTPQMTCFYWKVFSLCVYLFFFCRFNRNVCIYAIYTVQSIPIHQVQSSSSFAKWTCNCELHFADVCWFFLLLYACQRPFYQLLTRLILWEWWSFTLGTLICATFTTNDITINLKHYLNVFCLLNLPDNTTV